ncbi:MAG TPA: hypothetical protein VFK44_04120 [Bacillales bacterium]|nr:hypothetical protein [Bacillales bacterium]
MYKAHGIGFAEYGRSLENRLKVEKEREKSYQKSMKLIYEHERKIAT